MEIDIDKELLKNSALAWFYLNVRNHFSLSTILFFLVYLFSGAAAYTETNVENSNLNRKTKVIFSGWTADQ